MLPEHFSGITRHLSNSILKSGVYAYGFSLRKRSIIRRFSGNVPVRFIHKLKHIPPESPLLVWGSCHVPSEFVADEQIVRVEDGFLRSIGLGADLIKPLSLVADLRGIYYDPTKPSDLEHLLQTTEFRPELIERASKLRLQITKNSLTKYSTGGNNWCRSSTCLQTGQRVILVPGQVESDASIRYGAPGIQTNIRLLQAVREENSNAYVIYKPHPDVVAGLRAKGKGEDSVQQWCDEFLVDVSIAQLLTEVDEVHVMTSLTGFEALLRGIKVTCYGQPFYSGWGLTKDIEPVSRRTRRLSLDMLVAGALILYPTYVSKITGKITTPECAIDDLLTWRAKTQSTLSLSRKVVRFAIKCFTKT